MRKVIIGLLVYSCLITLVSYFSQRSVNDSWRYFGVPTLDKLFADMAVITAASGCQLPYERIVIKNCIDGISPFNYPRIWVILGRLGGLSLSNTTMLAVIAIILFSIAYLYVFRKAATAHWLYIITLVCSPVVMLAVSRGNSDLIIFCLIVIMAVFISQQRTFFSMTILLAASVLKLYPIFALLALLKRTKNYFLILCAGLFCLYCYLTIKDLTLVASATPRGYNASYGKFVFIDYVNHYFPNVTLLAPLPLLHTIASTIAIFLPLVFIFLKKEAPLPLPELLTPPKLENTLFLAGSSIYVCTFLIGNNWDYRLIFLHLIIPYLLLKVEETSSHRYVIRLLLLVTVFVSWSNLFVSNFQGQNWYRPVRFVCTILEELGHWVVYTILCSAIIIYSRECILTVFSHWKRRMNSYKMIN